MQNHTVSLSRQVISTFHLAFLALLQGTGVLCHSCISSQSHNLQCVRRLASMWMSLPSQAANPSMQWLITSASLCMPFLTRETLLPLFSAACLTHLVANM